MKKSKRITKVIDIKFTEPLTRNVKKFDAVKFKRLATAAEKAIKADAPDLFLSI